MNIALAWWDPSTGGSQQAIRGNALALREAGHDVDLYLGTDVLDLEARAAAYDAVVLPFIHYDGDWAAYEDTHIHLQLGGFPAESHPGLTRHAIQQADTVSVLDPSLLAYYEQQFQVDAGEIALVPNAPNRALFERQPLAAADGHALVAKLGSANKGAREFAEVVQAAPNVPFVVHYMGEDAPSLPDSVTLRPPVPFTAMPRQYRRARLVLNPSARDVLPNTAFEAFLSGRPYLCRGTAIGQIQSIPADTLAPGHWGRSVAWWRDAVGPAIGEGRHYVACESSDALGEAATTLMAPENADAREEIVTAADEWLDAWGDWDWESKGHTLTAVIESGGPL